VNQPLNPYPYLIGVARVIEFAVHFTHNVGLVSKNAKIRMYEFINCIVFAA